MCVRSLNKLHVSVACFLIASSSNAIIVKLADLQTMAKNSDVVIHGTVIDQTVVEDDLSRLITLTQIEVLDGLYGAKTGEVITVYQVGGEKNGLVMPLLGGHKYSVGQELFMFGLTLGNAYVSYGAGQGKLDILESEDQESIVEDLGDVHAINEHMKDKNRIFQPMPLRFDNKTTLKNEIRQMIKAR